jgi:hypothetical protein
LFHLKRITLWLSLKKCKLPHGHSFFLPPIPSSFFFKARFPLMCAVVVVVTVAGALHDARTHEVESGGTVAWHAWGAAGSHYHHQLDVPFYSAAATAASDRYERAERELGILDAKHN